MEDSSGNGAPLVIALTGGIAAGKTEVSDRFARLGVPIIDTDLIARELVEPGQPLLAAVGEVFGPDVLDDQGRLRRRHLRELVFSDPALRGRLEAILHPEILRVMSERIAATRAPYCVVVIPLLAETGRFPGVHRVLLVEADREARIGRIMERDRVGRDEARSIIAAQAGDEKRRTIADDVIRNDGALEELDKRVERLHARYLGMAKDRDGVTG